MGIDPSQLAPWAQKQIAQKLAAQMREKAEDSTHVHGEAKRKYRNTPTDRHGADSKTIRFDSKREAIRYDELMLLLKSGKIKNLKLQPQYTLQEAYTTPEGNRVRAIRYQADFSYEEAFTSWGEPTSVIVVEDVKSPASKTRVYEMKKKLLLERFGIEITEVE